MDTIDKYANDNLNGDKYEVYNRLFNEEKLTFDLLTTQSRFKNNKNRQISNCSKFSRSLSFKGVKNLIWFLKTNFLFLFFIKWARR